jgi:hypothetical protein
MACGDETYAATLDAEFAVRGLKLPPGEQNEPEGIFEERMLFIETFWNAWLSLFDRFLDLRGNARQWAHTLDAMRQWVSRLSSLPAK